MTTATITALGDRRTTPTSTGTSLRRAAFSAPPRSSTPSPREGKLPRVFGRTLSMLMITLRHSGWRNACKFMTTYFSFFSPFFTPFILESLEGPAVM